MASSETGRNATVDRSKLAEMRMREDTVFYDRIPQSKVLLERAKRHMPQGVPMAWMAGLYRFHTIFIADSERASFRDVDGNAYLDFNVCDLAMTMGYGPAPIVKATSEQMARGAHFLLATEDAIAVAEDLAARTGMPYWQFTVSASSANTEVLRIARHMTGRQKVLVFGGHYHGHIDETLVSAENGRSVPELLGLPRDAAERTIIVPFNDLAAAEHVLAKQDVALVLTEPALTNCNIVLPEPGFHQGLREITQRHGTLLCIDEAHTFQFAYGGLTKAWDLASDFMVLGKGLGTGLSFALYGMQHAVADHLTRYRDIDIGPKGLATGGTTYGSAVSVAVAKAALLEVMTPANYQRVIDLGTKLSDGLESIFAQRRLPWRAFRLGPRAGYCMSTELPHTGEEAALSLDAELIDTRRIYLANRGIWDAVVSAGPQASFAHEPADIALYLKTADDFIGEIVT